MSIDYSSRPCNVLSKRPLVPLVIAFISGVLGATEGRLELTTIMASLFACAIISLYALLRHRYLLMSCLTILFFASLGGLLGHHSANPNKAANHINSLLKEGHMVVEGIICEPPQTSADRTELIVDSWRVRVNDRYEGVTGRILVSVLTGGRFSYGQLVRINARLRAPHNYDNPGGFDYKRYCLHRGISAQCYINDPTHIVVLRNNLGNPLLSAVEDLREVIRRVISAANQGAEGKIIRAIILGEQREIPKEVTESFNRTGTTHIIAISGFNIGIIAVFCLFIIRLVLKSSPFILLRWDINKIATFLTLFVIVAYTFIAGAGISVVRASIMAGVFMVAIIFNRDSDLYNTLAFAALLILVISPLSLFDVSFQLSFVAVLSIIFLTSRLSALEPSGSKGPFLSKYFAGKYASAFSKITRGVVLWLAVSLSATLGTYPLIVYHFNRLSLISPIANAVVAPLLGTITIPLCLLVVIIAPFSPQLSAVIVKIAALLVKASLSLIDYFASLSWASVFLPTPTFPELLLFYGMVISLAVCIERLIARDKALNAGLFLLGMAAFVSAILLANHLVLQKRIIHPPRQLAFTAVDVGQGAAALISLPDARKILVDGGGTPDDRFDVGRYVLAPFLWNQRISKIEAVVLSHPHPDHLQGLLFILEHFEVREVWTNDLPAMTDLETRLFEIIKRRGIVHKSFGPGISRLILSGASLQIINPQSPAKPLDGEKDLSPSSAKFKKFDDIINDSSLMLKISHGRRSFLLTGDILSTTERRLVDMRLNLQSDVLFVPHHGSQTSTTADFLKAVRPGFAVISCGKKNVFKFPHQAVLERLAATGARIYRTDRHGAVTFFTDGSDLGVVTFNK